MQLSIETTTQSASILSATLASTGSKQSPLEQSVEENAKAPAASLLEAASKKAEDDAVVIAALQAAVEKGKGATDEDSNKAALASVEDYQKTAGKLKSALGDGDIRAEGSAQLLAYESATITTTTIEAEIGDNTLSAEFVSFERTSYNSDTGLSVRSASASNVEADFGNVTASYQNASVSSLYAGSGKQLGNFFQGTA